MLVIVPHDGAAMAKAVTMAHQAGIPVIAYDRLIRDSDLDMYVSFDNVRVGELQAQFVIDQLKGKGKIVRIYGSKTDNNAALFKQGQDNVLKPYLDRGDIQVVHEDWADDWKPENAKRIMNAAITAKGNAFDAVLASNDGTAGGAIQALTEEGLAGQDARHRPGRRARRLPADRHRHAGDDDLQAAEAARQQRRGARREAGRAARSSSPARPPTTARSPSRRC